MTSKTLRLTLATATAAALLATGPFASGARMSAQAPQATADRAPSPDAAQVSTGRRIYEVKRCRVCHFAEGQGNRRFPLDGITPTRTTDDLRRWITTPAAMEVKLDRKPAISMPGYRLDAADLDALVAYLRTLKK